MPFKKNPQVFNAKIGTVTIGTGDKAVTMGGANVMPLYTFDAPLEHRPVIGFELSDKGVNKDLPKQAEYFKDATTIVDEAKVAAGLPGVDFLDLVFTSADPDGDNTSVEDCVALAKEISEAVDVPLAFEGCKNVEKDEKLYEAVAEALQGKNVLVLSAREEDYKGIGAAAGMAYKQKIGAESAVDINLAKQLNTLITQLGVPADQIVMNLGSSAAGYGYEYLASTLDRVKAAALGQNDAMLQMPVITPVGTEAWGVKEALAEESDYPEWGPREERGIQMEICTAAAALAGGSDALLLRHPDSIKTLAALIADLM